MPLLPFHEPVADHMQHDHMKVLDPPGVGMGDLNIDLGQRPQAAAIPARQSDRPAADGVAVFHRAQDVRGIAGAADPHDDVPGFGEILQLLDEDAFVADIVGVGGDGGKRISEGQDAEARKRARSWRP